MTGEVKFIEGKIYKSFYVKFHNYMAKYCNPTQNVIIDLNKIFPLDSELR
jgi:hypothetical protein